MESTTKLYSLNYTNANTYLFAFVFIVGNVVLPQLCHLVHLGGPAMLMWSDCILAAVTLILVLFETSTL